MLNYLIQNLYGYHFQSVIYMTTVILAQHDLTNLFEYDNR